jgi:hypothetical protein
MLALCLLLPVLTLAQPVSVSDASDDLLSAFEPNTTAWSAGARDSYSVWGSSCNTTQLELIGQGLAQTQQLASHARDHIRRFGNDTLSVPQRPKLTPTVDTYS